jgi:glucan phosphoethanolaminetransferase (alkaline phosphatase superfamily)
VALFKERDGPSPQDDPRHAEEVCGLLRFVIFSFLFFSFIFFSFLVFSFLFLFFFLLAACFSYLTNLIRAQAHRHRSLFGCCNGCGDLQSKWNTGAGQA